jgi:gag-polypeptide of LTR copia-type
LIAESALDIVKGIEQAPPAGNTQNSFQIFNRKAYAIIVGSCTPSAKSYFKGISDVAEIWRILHEKLGTINPRATQLALSRAFLSLKPQDSDTTINDHITRIRNARDELAGSPREISDEAFISNLIGTIPSAYNLCRRFLNHAK